MCTDGVNFIAEIIHFLRSAITEIRRGFIILSADSASFGSAGTADFNGHAINQEMGFLSNNGIGEPLLQFLGFKAEPAPPLVINRALYFMQQIIG